MPANSTPHPSTGASNSPTSPSSANQRPGYRPPRNPRDPPNNGGRGPRRPSKTPTQDIRVPEGTSLGSVRSAGTHPVADGTMDSFELLAQEFARRPEAIDDYIASVIILDAEPTFKHKIELGTYYRSLSEDVLRYRFGKYNEGSFWHELRNKISIVKDSPTSMYIATSDRETSNAIAGRSFVLDIEAANAMPDFTVPSYSPYDDKYFITFDAVPEPHLQKAIVKWIAQRSSSLLTAYNPSRLDDFRGGKFRVVFRTKEVPALLKLADGTPLREITVVDEKLGEEVTLIFHHKLQYLNRTVPPSVFARWTAAADSRRSRESPDTKTAGQTKPTHPGAEPVTNTTDASPIVADNASSTSSSGLATLPPASKADDDASTTAVSPLTPATTPASTASATPTSSPPVAATTTATRSSSPVFFIDDRPDTFYKPSLEDIPTANSYGILGDEEDLDETEEDANEDMTEERTARIRTIRIGQRGSNAKSKKRPNRKHGDPKHLEKLAQRPTKKTVEAVDARVQAAPSPVTFIEQMIAEPAATFALLSQDNNFAHMMVNSHVLWREISKSTEGPKRLATLSHLVNSAPTASKDPVSVVKALVPDEARRLELTDAAAFDLFLICYIPDLYFNDHYFAMCTGAPPLRTRLHNDWADESLVQLILLDEFRHDLASQPISPYFQRAMERFHETTASRAASSTLSTAAPEPQQN